MINMLVLLVIAANFVKPMDLLGLIYETLTRLSYSSILSWSYVSYLMVFEKI